MKPGCMITFLCVIHVRPYLVWMSSIYITRSEVHFSDCNRKNYSMYTNIIKLLYHNILIPCPPTKMHRNKFPTNVYPRLFLLKLNSLLKFSFWQLLDYYWIEIAPMLNGARRFLVVSKQKLNLAQCHLLFKKKIET